MGVVSQWVFNFLNRWANSMSPMSDWIGIKQESEIYRLEKRLSWDEVNLLLDLLFNPWFFEFNLLSSL
jgi:hypothetical protein